MTYDVKTNVKVPKQTIKPEMLVTDANSVDGGAIGIVVQVTRKWVHVLWLVNTKPGVCYKQNGNDLEDATFWNTRGQHHFVTQELRQDLIPCPVGTTVTVTQTMKG